MKSQDHKASGCPVMHGSQTRSSGTGTRNEDWWPNALNLSILSQSSRANNPMDEGFDYRAAFNSVDLAVLKEDLAAIMTDSKDWWPADYGHYGPFMIRMRSKKGRKKRGRRRRKGKKKDGQVPVEGEGEAAADAPADAEAPEAPAPAEPEAPAAAGGTE